MTPKIETNSRGVEEIVGENSRGQTHVIEATRIFVRASDGHVFLAPMSERPNLVPLNPHEVVMVLQWLRERDGPHFPNVFAGEAPSDG